MAERVAYADNMSRRNRGLEAALSKLGPEGHLQLLICDWLQVVAPWGPKAPFQWCAIRNESPRSAVGQMVETRLGRRPGVADILVWGPSTIAGLDYGGEPPLRMLWVELKAGKNKQTDKQLGFGYIAAGIPGCNYSVCRSLKEFREILHLHLNGFH